VFDDQSDEENRVYADATPREDHHEKASIVRALYVLAVIAAVTVAPSQARENSLLAETLTGCNGRRAAGADYRSRENAAGVKDLPCHTAADDSGVSDGDLKAPVKIFGKDMTKEGAVRHLFGDQHEHLDRRLYPVSAMRLWQIFRGKL